MLIDDSKCVGCGNCVAVCPMGAIHVENNVANINQREFRGQWEFRGQYTAIDR